MSVCTLFYCFSAPSLSVKLMSDRSLSIKYFWQTLAERRVLKSAPVFLSTVVIKEFVSSLVALFRNAWLVARGQMCVLDGFRRFEMSFNIKDRLFLESFRFPLYLSVFRNIVGMPKI